MATIPIPLYQQQQRVSLNTPMARAPGIAVEDNTGRAIAGIGQALGQVANAYQRQQDELQKAEASKTLSKAVLDFDQYSRDSLTSADPGAPGYAERFNQFAQDYVAKAVEPYQGTARGFLDGALNDLSTRATIKARDNQARAGAQHWANNLEAATDNYAKAAYADPGSFDSIVAPQLAIIDSIHDLSPETKANMKRGFLRKVGYAAEVSKMQAAPADWLQNRRAPSGTQGVISTAADLNGIEPAYMLAVADIETGGTFDPSAKNPRSTAGGLFQFTDPTWNQYAPGQDKNDPVANARAAASFSADNRKSLVRTLGRQPQGWEMYLAHQQGAGGAAALLRANPDATVASALKEAGVANADRAANDNGMSGMLVKDALAMWEGKFSRSYAKHAGAGGNVPQATTHDGYPARQNADGSISTELSITVTHPDLNGGKPTNIPSLWSGKEVDEETAVANAVQSGKTYQPFDSIDSAVNAAQARSAAGGAQAGRSGIPSFDNLSWDDQQKLEQKAITTFKQYQSEQRAVIDDSIRDQEATWLSGQDYTGQPVSKEQFVQAYGVADGLSRWGRHQDIYQTGQDIQALSNLSNVEIIGALDARRPVGGPGFEADAKRFDVLQRAANSIIDQRKKDPASFVLSSNPTVRSAYDAMASASPESIKDATQSYASRSAAEQERLGVDNPRLLSTAHAQNLVQQFFDQREGGNNAANLVMALEDQWGTHWPAVYKQLAETGKLPPVALVIPNMADPGARERAARRTLIDDDVYKKRLDSTAPRDIETALTEEMGDLWNSFSSQNGGVNTYQAIYNEAKKAALEYAAGGKSIRDAVGQAYDEFVGQSYDFGDTYRVPLVEQPEKVIRGSRATINGINGSNIAIPPSLAGLPIESTKVAWVNSIKANGQFVTNGDESGLILYVMGNNGLNAVLDTQGQPMSFTWEQLRAADKPIDLAHEQVNEIPAWTPEAYR